MSHSGSLLQHRNKSSGRVFLGLLGRYKLSRRLDPRRASLAGQPLTGGSPYFFLRVMKSEDDPEDGENNLGIQAK